MSAGLIQTGVVEIAGRYVFDLAGRNPAIFLPVIMVSVAAVSAFMSNTAATAFFVPLVIGYASKIGASPSKFLLPLAFASILTSSVTLISTSTNLVVSDLLTRYQQPPMGMFELAPVGIPIAVVGILYVWAIGVRLIPQREDQKAEEKIGERKYQADVVVAEDGPLVGKSLEAREDHRRCRTYGRQAHPRRGNACAGRRSWPISSCRRGTSCSSRGCAPTSSRSRTSRASTSRPTCIWPIPTMRRMQSTIVEGVLLPRSPLIGHSLRSLEFKERYGLQVLAIHRAGRVPKTISSARLRMGDVLLLQGTPDDVKALERGNLFNIFGGVEQGRLNRSRAPLAAAIFALAILAATFKLASLPVAMLGGAFLMLLTRCLSPEEAYRQVEWKVLILIGALLSLGAAMEASGAGKYLAQQLIAVVGAESRYALLTCFFVLTVALTQPMSNQAAALVVFPIAMQTGPAARRRSPRLRHDGGRGRKLLLPDAARALLPHGLRARQISVLRFLQGGHAPDRPDLWHCHRACPLGLADVSVDLLVGSGQRETICGTRHRGGGQGAPSCP